MYEVGTFVKMQDCYLNYETRFTKFRNLNKVWIDTRIEIYLFSPIDSPVAALNKSNPGVDLFYLMVPDLLTGKVKSSKERLLYIGNCQRSLLTLLYSQPTAMWGWVLLRKKEFLKRRRILIEYAEPKQREI